MRDILWVFSRQLDMIRKDNKRSLSPPLVKMMYFRPQVSTASRVLQGRSHGSEWWYTGLLKLGPPDNLESHRKTSSVKMRAENKTSPSKTKVYHMLSENAFWVAPLSCHRIDQLSPFRLLLLIWLDWQKLQQFSILPDERSRINSKWTANNLAWKRATMKNVFFRIPGEVCCRRRLRCKNL